ncbi:MAG: hypothetical protein JNM65_14990 [Verrucomicrobiaceae bacterium]|nr:hypothetical protein [Verrucomicrobiaceae bacterium]
MAKNHEFGGRSAGLTPALTPANRNKFQFKAVDCWIIDEPDAARNEFHLNAMRPRREICL